MHVPKPRHDAGYRFHVAGVSISLSHCRPVFLEQMQIHLHLEQMVLNLPVCFRGQIAVVLSAWPPGWSVQTLFAISYATVHPRKGNLGPSAELVHYPARVLYGPQDAVLNRMDAEHQG